MEKLTIFFVAIVVVIAIISIIANIVQYKKTEQVPVCEYSAETQAAALQKALDEQGSLCDARILAKSSDLQEQALKDRTAAIQAETKKLIESYDLQVQQINTEMKRQCDSVIAQNEAQYNDAINAITADRDAAIATITTNAQSKLDALTSQLNAVNAEYTAYKDARTRQYRMDDNADYAGNDIAYLDVPYPQCGEICSLINNCAGYGENKDAGRGCWLKHRMATRAVANNRRSFIKL